MIKATGILNEQNAAAAFTGQSPYFDELYSGDGITAYKRNRVRDVLESHFSKNSLLLELNAGTGEDAVFLARKGYRVHATDISEGMLEKLEEKISSNRLNEFVTAELCSFTALNNLKNKGPYDGLFSNFAGLNCTPYLPAVLHSFDQLLKPGAVVVLVVLPKFCLWELLLLFKGKFKTATRRLFARNGSRAKIDSHYFRCWYYNPAYIKRILKDKYEWLGTEGLCTIVPPSYIKGFANKYPAVFDRLVKIENRFRKKWPWKNIGDYYIISLRKK
jgi:ubiquinone/menaquinone biosynthesis C-methylase UbiE